MAVFDIFTDANGVKTDWNYTFDVLGSFSAVVVKTKLPSQDGFVTRTEDVDYVHTPATKLIEFQSGYIPVTGETIRIERYTNRDRQVDYIGGSTLSEANLDNDANRLTSVDQEIEAGITNALRKNDAGTAWNGEGLPSESCAPAEAMDGWVTLAQLEERLSGVELVDLTEPLVYQFSGDGTTAEFSLAGVSGLKRSQVDVYVQQVYQSCYPDTAEYDIIDDEESSYPTWGAGEDVLVFTEAPPSGHTIEVKVFTGQVLGVLPNDFVLGENIAADAVGLEHINIGTSALEDRLLTFNGSGDPTAEQIGLQHLLVANQTIPDNVRAALNHVSTGLHLAGFLRPPQANVDFGTKAITGLGSRPTYNASDAATKGYVQQSLPTHNFASVNLSDDMPTLGNSYFVTLGFQPQLCVISGQWRADETHQSTWVAVFRSGQLERLMIGSLSTRSFTSPRLRLTANPLGVNVQFDSAPDGKFEAWSNVALFALRA